MRLTFLGTGTSVGVPMIGCDCSTCLSDDPRDKRLRTGLLVEHAGQSLVIDISPDFRQQALRSRMDKLDALLITHCHADHVFGLDDIRPFNFRQGPLPVHASASTWKQLRKVFYYIFEATYVGGGLPQITPHTIDGDFEVCGLKVIPFEVTHGGSMVSGFRLEDERSSVAFITDCNDIPEVSLAKLYGLDVLIIDALRYRPHPTHLHVEKSLAYIAQLEPRRALLTHMSHDIKHLEASILLPQGVEFAFDDLRIEL
ncbi:MAG: MBL fold metallo-hydrolase [Acidobacteriota bacterium]